MERSEGIAMPTVKHCFEERYLQVLKVDREHTKQKLEMLTKYVKSSEQ